MTVARDAGRRVGQQWLPTSMIAGDSVGRAVASVADKPWPMMCTGLRCHGQSFALLGPMTMMNLDTIFLSWKRQSIGLLSFVWLVFPR